MNNTKTISIVLIVIIIIAGGWYAVTKNQKSDDVKSVDTNIELTNKVGNDDIDNMQNKDDDSIKSSVSSTITTPVVIKEFTVEGTNFKFVPSTILVNKGDTVKINFKNTQGFHDFVVDEFGAATKQIKDPSTETITFVADKVGTFEYYCSVGQHRSMGMKGTLTVK